MKIFYLFCIGIIFASCQNQAPKVEEPSNYYTEQHRPQFHFTPEKSWMNDPNGMVYYDGEYHLFYQYFPDSTVWGPMHWGHAVTKDLISWEHLPIALYPDSLGYIFSGSAVADVNNTAGFKNGSETPLVAMFTSHDIEGEKAGKMDYETQSIAYSTDKGRTWTKYAANPVLKNPGRKDFRDPKVSWHEPSQRWVLVFAAGDEVLFYNAPNLKDWTQTGSFGKNMGAHGGVWECPDLFPLTVNDTTKWVLLVSINPGGPNGGSATQYFVGDFDGKTFKNDNPDATELWIDYGTDNYAGVTWANVSEKDGRRLFLGWMSNWLYAQVVPTESWRSAMTLPRTLELRQTPQGFRVISTPVKELEKLRDKSANLSATTVQDELDLSATTGITSTTSELILEFDLEKTKADDFGVELSNTKGETFRIGYQSKENQFYADRRNAGKMNFSDQFAGLHIAPRLSDDRTLQLHFFIDVASIELFADAGSTVMTELFFPTEDFTKVKIFAKNGTAALTTGKVWRLKSVWQNL